MFTTLVDEAIPAGMERLPLRSYEGLSYRLVSTKPARDCTPEEIPIIDLGGMSGDLQARLALAAQVLGAAETSGFFYIKNHGIPDSVIQETLKVSKRVDRKESFSFHYKPEFDPVHRYSLSKVPRNVIDHIPKDDCIWTPVGLPHMQETYLSHWRSCLGLARGLIRIIALALNLPEDYFDRCTTYPGADFAVNFYPGHGDDEIADPDEVGVGAHTDLQILTLLWQDEHGGLQVLNSSDEWIHAPPIEGTLVVNIGDFFMRLTNDRLKSTVHRVIQHGREDRYSIPFFFGFNFDERLGVVPTCVDSDHPAKYEPVMCGELIAKRLAQGSSQMQA
ncbi:hypothetical protein ACJ41O_000707 [Fusarium nematophilum]